MAHAQFVLPYKLITPDYIPFEHGESLQHYAKRFCDYLIDTHKIDLTQPLFLAGYSMGSAIGQEIMDDIPIRGLILIGGLLSSIEIGPIPRLFGKYLGWWLPLWYYRISEPFIAPFMRVYSNVSEDEIQLAVSMYHDLPRGLFREAYHSLIKWRASKNGAIPPTVPYLRIHGAEDQIVTCPQPGPNVIIIPKAKHLVGQAKPEPVNAAIEAFISRVMINNE